MAEENSRELRQRTRALTEELKSKMRLEELETLDHTIMAAVERNPLLTTTARGIHQADHRFGVVLDGVPRPGY
jgi:hypothetical protein